MNKDIINRLFLLDLALYYAKDSIHIAYLREKYNELEKQL